MKLSNAQIDQSRVIGGHEMLLHLDKTLNQPAGDVFGQARIVANGAQWSMSRALATNAATGAGQRAQRNRAYFNRDFPASQFAAGSALVNAEGDAVVCSSDEQHQVAQKNFQMATGALLALSQLAAGADRNAVKTGFATLKERGEAGGYGNILYQPAHERTPYDRGIQLMHAARHGFQASTALSSPGHVVQDFLANAQASASGDTAAGARLLNIATSQTSFADIINDETPLLDNLSSFLIDRGTDPNSKLAAQQVKALRIDINTAQDMQQAAGLLDGVRQQSDDPQVKASASVHIGRILADAGNKAMGVQILQGATSAPEAATAAFAHSKIAQNLSLETDEPFAMFNYLQAAALSPNPAVVNRAVTAIQNAGYHPDLTLQDPDA